MSEVAAKAPACPGCHFGCRLDAYQCARGKGLHARWLAGEHIPERRPPWMRANDAAAAEGDGQGVREGTRNGVPADGQAETKPGSHAETRNERGEHNMAQGGTRSGGHRMAHDRIPADGPSANGRAMHMLNIAAIALRDHAETRAERLALNTVARHEGSATKAIIGGRTRLSGGDLDETVEGLVEGGALEPVQDEAAGTLYALTETGRSQAEAWRKEREAADAAFLDALSDDEKAQLADLVAKLLTSSAHQHQHRRPQNPAK